MKCSICKRTFNHGAPYLLVIKRYKVHRFCFYNAIKVLCEVRIDVALDKAKRGGGRKA